MYGKHRRVYCLPAVFFLTVLTASASSTVPAAGAAPKLLRECPGGKLYQVGRQRLLVLSGTPYQMGLAHGKLLRNDVRTVADTVLTVARAADAVRNKDFFAGSIEQAYRRLKPFIPQRYQQELRGLADGAGLALKDVQLANVFPALFHCSGFALFGRATRDGQLLHGRVLDYMTSVGLQAYAVTMVIKPKGHNAFVNVGYAGFIGSVTGMNEKQIAVGEMGGRGEGQWDGMPMPMLFRKVLEEAGTLQQAVDIFRKTPRTCEYYYVVSDGKIPDARGLYCTPNEFVVLKPGQKHERLPGIVGDAVVFSADDRFEKLLDRIRKNYGTINPAIAIELMTRPVAMKSNLHNVLFAPTSMKMWVAHADPDLTKPKYQACFQKYRHYDVRELMQLLPAVASAEKIAAPAAPAQTADAAASQPAEQTGRVPATVFRPMAPCADPELAKLLKKFDQEPASFEWRMRQFQKSGSFVVHTVEFPSPYVSPVPCNNTVHCEYFLAGRKGRRPAVIVLHILDGSFIVARIICHRLASSGINALLVKMPYYGPRRPADKAKLRKITSDLKALIEGVTQAIMDVRRAATWLSTRSEVDPNRIGLCGVSLGGFVAAAAGGIDGAFPHVAVILAGGDLATMITSQTKETKSIRNAINKKNWTLPRVREFLHPIDPLTYAPRLKSSKFMMINATRDKIVPIRCARSLARASGAEISLYPADHYSMVVFLPAALEKLARHFSEANQPATAGR